MIELTQNSHVGALRYDEVRGAPLILNAEEAVQFDKQASALRKLLNDKTIVAKYKVEILFGTKRSVHNPIPGVMSFWLSGSRFHGGGDDKLYLCPGVSPDKKRCSCILRDSYNGPTGIVCPTCGSIWTHEQVIGELLFNVTLQNWAYVVLKYFRHFECNSDIYLKYAPDDLRSIALAQSAKQTWQGSQGLERARAKRARSIYPLKNILKETSAGADLLKRFYAYLSA